MFVETRTEELLFLTQLKRILVFYVPKYEVRIIFSAVKFFIVIIMLDMLKHDFYAIFMTLIYGKHNELFRFLLTSV